MGIVIRKIYLTLVATIMVIAMGMHYGTTNAKVIGTTNYGAMAIHKDCDGCVASRDCMVD